MAGPNPAPPELGAGGPLLTNSSHTRVIDRVSSISETYHLVLFVHRVLPKGRIKTNGVRPFCVNGVRPLYVLLILPLERTL
jgi:hypothetical protein